MIDFNIRIHFGNGYDSYGESQPREKVVISVEGDEKVSEVLSESQYYVDHVVKVVREASQPPKSDTGIYTG